MEKYKQKVYCILCKRKTNHGILHKHEICYRDPEDLSYEEKYIIAECLGCECINFIHVYTDETMVYFNPYEDDYIHEETVYVYPPEPIEDDAFEKKNNRPEVKLNNLPELIQRLYSEVITSYNNKSYLLCAIGLRMLVEGICKDLNIVDGPVFEEGGSIKLNITDGSPIRNKKLYGQINGLIEKNIIVQPQAKILHEIRDLGNQTAHELIIPKAIILNKAIDIIESIIHTIYELNSFSILK